MARAWFTSLAGLFFQRHALHQVGRALLGGQAGIQVRGLLRILRQ